MVVEKNRQEALVSLVEGSHLSGVGVDCRRNGALRLIGGCVPVGGGVKMAQKIFQQWRKLNGVTSVFYMKGRRDMKIIPQFWGGGLMGVECSREDGQRTTYNGEI